MSNAASALDLICFGEAMVEFVRTESAGTNDGDSHATSKVAQPSMYRQGFGGDTSNAAIAASRQGARTGYMTAEGADDFGDDLIALWQQEGIDTSAVRRVEQQETGLYFVRPHASGRHFTYRRAHSAASRYTAADLPLDYIASSRALHVSAISQAISNDMRHAVTKAMQHAHSAGVQVSYDTNLRLQLWTLDDARDCIFEALQHADIVFPSDDEGQQLTGKNTDNDIIDAFLDAGPKLVVFSRGERGAIIATPGQRVEIPPVTVKAVDSTGAGDAYAGAFLAHYGKHQDPEAAGHAAAAVAAAVVGGYGATDPIPYLV